MKHENANFHAATDGEKKEKKEKKNKKASKCGEKQVV